MTQAALFARASRCGYCGRDLVAVADRFECPRCALKLRVLAAVGCTFEEAVAAFRRFQEEAARS